MAVCGLRTLLLIVCVVELIVTIQRQIFDFLGYMWLPIIANFLNILLIIFGSFGAVQHISKYLLAYAIWSFMWLMWNVFLICYYLNLGTLNRESGLLSLGTGSVSWWEGNGWGCQPVWGEADSDTVAENVWRPVRVDGCLLPWHRVELAQSVLALLLTASALPLATSLACQHCNHRKPASSDKSTLPRRPVYTIELHPAETTLSENLKPMTPRRVKRRSGSRGSGRRSSRRSYRNKAYSASTASLARAPQPTRPTSAHSSYSNFHEARPISYHGPEEATRSQDLYDPPPPDVSRYEHVGYAPPPPGHDVAGPYNEPPLNYHNETYDNLPRPYDARVDNASRADTVSPYDSRPDSVLPFDGRADTVSLYEPPAYRNTGYGTVSNYTGAPPPPAPPYSARATPQAPGPPAYQPCLDHYSTHHRM